MKLFQNANLKINNRVGKLTLHPISIRPTEQQLGLVFTRSGSLNDLPGDFKTIKNERKKPQGMFSDSVAIFYTQTKSTLYLSGYKQ